MCYGNMLIYVPFEPENQNLEKGLIYHHSVFTGTYSITPDSEKFLEFI